MVVASPSKQNRLRPGQVRDAVGDALTDAGSAMSVKDIHAAVEAQLGTTVAESSVRSYLNLNTGPAKQFRRVQRGVYELS
ncbi:MAG: hypothetical protein OXG30_08505 [bacterium]|nr:hypothetical protein [bacterium]